MSGSKVSEVAFMLITVLLTIIGGVILFFVTPAQVTYAKHAFDLEDDPAWMDFDSPWEGCQYIRFNQRLLPCDFGFTSTVTYERNNKTMTIVSWFNAEREYLPVKPYLDYSCADEDGFQYDIESCFQNSLQAQDPPEIEFIIDLFDGTNTHQTLTWETLQASVTLLVINFEAVAQLGNLLTQYNNLKDIVLTSILNLNDTMEAVANLTIWQDQQGQTDTAAPVADFMSSCNTYTKIECSRTTVESGWNHFLRVFSYTFVIEVVIIFVYVALILFSICSRRGRRWIQLPSLIKEAIVSPMHSKEHLAKKNKKSDNLSSNNNVAAQPQNDSDQDSNKNREDERARLLNNLSTEKIV